VRVAAREVSAQSTQDWICISRGAGEEGRRARARHLVAAALAAALLASSLDRGILRLLQAATLLTSPNDSARTVRTNAFLEIFFPNFRKSS